MKGTHVHMRKQQCYQKNKASAARISTRQLLTITTSVHNRQSHRSTVKGALLAAPLNSEVKVQDIETYLISYPNLYNEGKENKNISKTSKTLKIWKEYCLGDGGVYFDKRPKALKALNSLLSTEIANYLHGHLSGCNDEITVETAVLSTCARFEILVVVERYAAVIESNLELNEILRGLVQTAVAKTLTDQICFQRRRKRYMLQSLLPFSILDLPSRIQSSIPPKSTKACSFSSEYENKLMDEVLFTEGVYDVSKRLCMIAAGLQDRILFRPFSARDSHIMQQMKRTADGSASYTVGESEAGSRKTYSKTLFDSALSSGKGSRSSKAIPMLEDLREASNGADGPEDLSRSAADSAISMVIIPTVNICVSKFKAMRAKSSIVDLRTSARLLASKAGLDFESEESTSLRSLIHEPTMMLRDGKPINFVGVLNEVEIEASRLKELIKH